MRLAGLGEYIEVSDVNMLHEFKFPRLTVPSGSYMISRSRAEILEAYLGTCVGVTMWDREAQVGGLAHLLLPEPMDIENPWQPGIYAATGVPLFIKALCREGATKEKLEACLAGGSLVGTVSGTDLALDIGGRTSDIVLEILSREGIPIRKSEIGGYFSCRLSLNLQTYGTSIEPIGIPEKPLVSASSQKISPRELERAVERVLPVPQVALKIIRMINDTEHNLSDLSKEIVRDQVLSAKVLRLCNSSYFGMRSKIDSIDRALMTLGNKVLVNIVLSSTIDDFLTQSEQGYSFCKGGLFKHALGTAMISQRLAKLTGKALADLAYTAGLLHDIGKVVLDQRLNAVYPLFYRGVQLEGKELIQMEKDVFGVSHTEAGNRLAQKWSFPDNLREIVTYHHFPERASVDSELCHIVYLADLIMSRFSVGQELEKMNTSTLDARLEKIGISPEQLPYLLDRVSVEITETMMLCGDTEAEVK